MEECGLALYLIAFTLMPLNKIQRKQIQILMIIKPVSNSILT